MQKDQSLDNKTSGFAPRFYSISLIIAGIVLVGLWLVTRYISLDVARDMRNWQEKLNLVAESRASEMTRYINGHFKELHGLADNPSLQLYLTELQMMPDDTRDKNGAPPAQLDYLRNLLIFTAQRGGYMGEGNNAIPANVESEYKGGLAVLNKDNQIVVSTNMPQSVKDQMVAGVSGLSDDKDTLIDMKKQDDGGIYLGFTVPIYSIQGERNADSLAGRVVAIKQVNKEFFDLLRHPGVTEKTLETTLVRVDGNVITFLTPLLDRSEALSKTVDKDARKFVEARLMMTVGNFISDMKDYAGKKVLATSREIPGTPWTMIVKVETEEALRVSSINRNNMIAFFFFVIVIIALVIVAIWWHASSKRSLMLSHHYRALAAQSRAQERLLRLVSDNQPESVYILDVDNQYQFANRNAVEHVGMSPEAVVGKHIRDVRGTARAEEIMDQAAEATVRQQICYHQYTEELGGMTQIVRSAYVPVAHIPVSHLPDSTPGVLVIEQDITEAVSEREKRLQISQDLIDTLVTLVDRRDPFAANHSLMVSGLALHVARQMELDHVTADTCRIAALLMNIGKIVISTKLLTKTDPLTDEERHIIRDSMFDAAELVKPIHFEGPVYETLRQWQEKWDGTGIIGLKGEHILITARVLSVANTFIGMVSPRSWRTAISTEEATQFLLDKSGTLFDRRVVVALVHFIENHHGKSWLAEVLSKQEAA